MSSVICLARAGRRDVVAAALAHGCSNLLFFNWRAMTRGAEQFCMGIIDHDNRRGRKYEEVRSIFESVKPYADILQTRIDAEVAVALRLR